MLNQVVLVGQIDSIYAFNNNEGKLEECIVSLCVCREEDAHDCKNIIDVNLSTLSTEINQFLETGITIGVKARLVYECNVLSVIAEKVTFINTKEASQE